MAIGDVFRLTVQNESALDLSTIVNVFHYRQETIAVEANEAEDLVVGWLNRVSVNYAGQMSDQVQVRILDAEQITNGVQSFEDILQTPLNGGQGGDPTAQQISALVSWRTALKGRSNRGRTFLPFTSELNMGGGLWGAGQLANMDAFAVDAQLILADAAHGEWQLVVWSDTLLTDQPVTDFISRNNPATIRRRRIGQGS